MCLTYKIDKRDVLKEMMEVNDLSIIALHFLTNISYDHLRKVIKKEVNISLNIARKLVTVFKDTDERFWLEWT